MTTHHPLQGPGVRVLRVLRDAGVPGGLARLARLARLASPLLGVIGGRGAAQQPGHKLCKKKINNKKKEGRLRLTQSLDRAERVMSKC